MKKIIGITALSLALVCAALLGTALAKRMGGGTSFGSRSGYSGGYSRPVSPTPGYVSPSSPQMNRQQTAPPAAPVTPPLQSPGMFSRMGWGLGGFMAGGLLGSMLFGGGMGGGWGGGGGIGLLDILLVGLIVYMIIRMVRGRSGSSGSSAASGTQAGAGGWQPPADARRDDTDGDVRSRAEQNWDALRSSPAQRPEPMGGFGVAPSQAEMPGPVVPQGFNVPEFLDGAKTVYARLQHSWDRRDLADIALFTTPEVLAEIKRQAAADPTPSKTELVMIEPRLLEFREEGGDTVVTVLFDVLLREDATEERPKQIREVWHFSRPMNNPEANWRLEGIQQLEV